MEGERVVGLWKALVEPVRHHLAGAGSQHARAHVLDVLLVRLTEIGGVSDDVDAVGGQPMGDRATVEAAGHGHENGLAFEVGQVHEERSPWSNQGG